MITRILAFLCASSISWATIHWVSENQSIQDAVNAAVDSDTILVQPGIHIDCVVLYGKQLTVGSLYLLDGDTAHIGQTIIIGDPDCPDTNSCFVYAYAEPVGGRLVGLTLSGGQGTYWTYGNGSAGGNVFVTGTAAVQIEHCRFEDASADFGGGLAICGNALWELAYCTLKNNTFTNCCDVVKAGGVYAKQCSLQVVACVFESDTSEQSTGGVYCHQSYVDIDSCTIRFCYGVRGGMLASSCFGRLTNSCFEQNGNNGGPLPCHLFVNASQLLISRCAFRNNSVTGIPITILGGAYATQFIGNLVENNTATLHSGIILSGSRDFGEIAYNIIRNNTSIEGGAISCFDRSHVRIHHNVIDSNISLDSTLGAALHTISDAYPSLDSNIISHHRPPIITIDPRWPFTMHAENNYWGHPSGPYHPTLNPGGQGDTLLSDSVLFIPWLTEPPDTTMPNDVPDRERIPISRTWELAELYPNPFNSSLQIVLAGFAGNDFEMTLHNLLGQIVDIIERGPLTGGHFTYQAPAWLSSGVYFVRAADRHALQTRKVVLLK